ncbi:MAG: alpha/beta fold hydrolase [Polyangiales bacterium]
MYLSRTILLIGALTTLCGCDSKSWTAPTVSSASVSATAAASSAAPNSATPADMPLTELGATIVGWMAAGENAKVRALFDDAMNKAVPTDEAVGKMWSNIETMVGKLDRLIETSEIEKGGYRIVLATCKFERSPMDVKMVFDKDRHLAGFFIVATQSANAFGPRPQMPKPPFAYEAREVSYDNAKDKMHFTGTLTLPPGAGPFPAVLLVTGSGTQDRDETIFGHKPFLLLADRLTKSGVAVLRVDDPGAGGSTGDAANATIEVHARDAEAGLAFLAAQKEIDKTRLGLIGHSEGGIIAAMVASRTKDVAFVVSLAGTGVSGAEINPLQIEAILRADGKIKEEGIKAVVEAQRSLMKLIVKGADEAALEAGVTAAFATAAKFAATDADKMATQKEMTASLGALNSPWFKSFVKLDPAPYWSKVTVPVLALIGDKDTQVPADVNLAAIKAALGKAKNAAAVTEKLPGLNHLFQPAKTGLLDEYATIETTFDEKALDRVVDWVTAHTKGK